MSCYGGAPHYCPNCDRTFDTAKDAAELDRTTMAWAMAADGRDRERWRAEQAEALLLDFAKAVKELAAKGYRHLDGDEESKAMKVLSALSGVPGCYPEIDKLYARIESDR